jgi:hypothetical protein
MIVVIRAAVRPRAASRRLIKKSSGKSPARVVQKARATSKMIQSAQPKPAVKAARRVLKAVAKAARAEAVAKEAVAKVAAARVVREETRVAAAKVVREETRVAAAAAE